MFWQLVGIAMFLVLGMISSLVWAIVAGIWRTGRSLGDW
jgi:hypothetical protein